jgi:hypothetical protein
MDIRHISHPFLSLPPGVLSRLFWPFFALTLFLMIVMAAAGAPLNTGAAPQGIISFEFAGSAARTAEILDSWGEAGRLRAAFIQGLDFLFLVVYSTTIALGCLWAARWLEGRGWRLSSLGILLAWGQGLAALFDTVENIALVLLLFGWLASPWTQVAWVCAAVKFALIFMGMVYAFFAAALHLAWR